MLKKLFTWLLIFSLSVGGIAPAAKSQDIIDHYRYAAGGVPAGPYLSSVQQFTVIIPAGNTSATTTITAVGSNAFIIWQGHTSAANSFTAGYGDLQLTDSTTVTGTRGASSSFAVTLYGVVVDPTSSLVSSVQQGEVTISGTSTSGTATISSVDTTRSVVFYLGINTNVASASNTNVVLTNATTVTASRNVTTSGTVNTGYVVVTYNTGIVKSLQTVNPSLNNTNTTDTSTITAVSTSNSFLAYGGGSGSSANAQTNMERAALASSTSVQFDRAEGTSATRTPAVTVVEFNSGILAQNQIGTITLTNATSNTATVTSATTTKSICSYDGNDDNNSSNVPTIVMSVNQTNATTLTGRKITAGTQVGKVNYTLLTYNQ